MSSEIFLQLVSLRSQLMRRVVRRPTNSLFRMGYLPAVDGQLVV